MAPTPAPPYPDNPAPMNIWLLHVGEELPVDESPRLFRYGHLAEQLTASGHEVLRWAPTFQHFRKYQRFASDQRVEVAPGYTIEFVHAPGYQRNVSVARFQSYKVLGRRLAERLKTQERPDLIVVGIPSLEWCEVAVDYANQFGIPVVLDVRDLWPDIYLQALPRVLQPLGHAAIKPLVRRIQRTCQNASAIYGVSQSYLDWGVAHAGRLQSPHDRVFPLGYQPATIDQQTLALRIDELHEQGVDTDKTICMFAGLIEKLYDVDTIITAADQLERTHPGKYQFVICGDGSKAPRIRRRAAATSNVVMLGWVEQQTIAALMSVASIGLASYTAGAPQSLPNKPFEYMAGGLAIATSLVGELPGLLSKHDCGATYQAGDAASLSQSILRLSADPQQLVAMQQRGQQLFESRFTVAQVYAQFVSSLEELHRNHHPHCLSPAA